MAREQCKLDVTPELLVMQGQQLKMHTVGKWGQEALAHYLCLDNPDKPMASIEDFMNDYDVYGIQARSTLHADGHLLTKPNDKPGPYCLITVDRKAYDWVECTLHGWQWLHLCNQDANWRTHSPYTGKPMPRPCYMTPQSALQPMDSIPIPQLDEGRGR